MVGWFQEREVSPGRPAPDRNKGGTAERDEIHVAPGTHANTQITRSRQTSTRTAVRISELHSWLGVGVKWLAVGMMHQQSCQNSSVDNCTITSEETINQSVVCFLHAHSKSHGNKKKEEAVLTKFYTNFTQSRDSIIAKIRDLVNANMRDSINTFGIEFFLKQHFFNKWQHQGIQ